MCVQVAAIGPHYVLLRAYVALARGDSAKCRDIIKNNCNIVSLKPALATSHQAHPAAAAPAPNPVAPLPPVNNGQQPTPHYVKRTGAAGKKSGKK